MTAREFTDIYSPLCDSLYRVAFYILESEQDAQDAVQDLYIKLWRSLDTLDNVYNPKAYCTRLLKNLCIDRIRAAGRIQTTSPPDTIQSGQDIEREMENREKLKLLTAKIEQLPQKQKEVLKMRVFEELSYEEITEKTGINYLTLRVLLSQARSKLKSLL